jgi:galactose-1-phosphate uridylyltransferase
VIANKYPAVTPFIPGSEPARDVHDCAQFGDASTVNNEVPAVGHHEVLIESPVHNHLAATGTGEQLSLLVRAWVSRTCTISQDTRIRQILCFKNQGGAAGASIVHPHSQIVALPLIPRLVETQLKHARDYYVKHGASVFKMMLREELAAGARVIESNRYMVRVCVCVCVCVCTCLHTRTHTHLYTHTLTHTHNTHTHTHTHTISYSHFAAFVPYAAICPFETWILPLRQQVLFFFTTIPLSLPNPHLSHSPETSSASIGLPSTDVWRV